MIKMFRLYASHEKWQECESLLDSQAVTLCDKLGNTLLLDYTFENNTFASELLIKHGSDVNAFNCNGKSPLIHAAMNKNEKLVELLLEKKADPNYARTNSHQQKIGSNALMFASEKDNLEIVKKLLSVTDINYRNDLKQTAFMYACKTQDIYQFEKIAEFVKNPDLKSDNTDIVGNTYLSILADQNNLSLLDRCVVELDLYHPRLLGQLRPSSTLKSSTLEHIENLYKRHALKTSLNASLTEKNPQKKLKI